MNSRSSIVGIMSIALAAMFVISAFSVVFTEDTEAVSSFTITDTTGREFVYDAPSEKVVVLGYAVTLTVAQSGMISKIYATDKYGKEAFADFDYIYTGNEWAPCFGSNADVLYDNLLQAVQKGDLSKEDTIILSTYSANVGPGGLRERLEEVGFTHVLFYGTMEKYDEVINCVKGICLSCGGDDLSVNMTGIRDKVTKDLKGVDPVDALFVWYSASGGWGFSSTGIAVSLMEVAGGKNLGYKEGKTGVVYDKLELIQRLEKSPEAFIFLDSGFIRSYEGTEEEAVNEFIKQVFEGDAGKHPIMVIQRTWNNYDADAAQGIWMMASALHSDLFDGDPQIYNKQGSSQDNTPLIIGGVVVVLVVIAGAIIILRRH